jgi:GTP cyclohydrolase IA
MLQPITGLRTVNESPAVEGLIRDLLYAVGEEPEREGLLDTPQRVRKSLAFLTQGYEMEPRDVLGTAIFEEDYDAMVVVKEIEFYSLCEHHMLPFFGKAHIAYVPNGRIVGLSKLPRLVEVFSRRLQVQERLTKQIAEALWETLEPRGVGVVIEAAHLCMMMRGVEKQQSSTVTSHMIGALKDDSDLRAEFLAQVRRESARVF